MGEWHSVEVTAGPYSWTVTPGQTAQVGDLTDQLRISTAWDEEHPQQGRPGPWTATFGIVVKSIRDVQGLDIGSPVSIVVRRAPLGAMMPWPAPDDHSQRPPLADFFGRVSDLSAAPDEDGRMIVTVTCTDYLVDLTSATVGLTAWPQELLADRVTRIFTEAKVKPFVDSLYGTVVAREASPINALDALQEALANDANGTIGRWLIPRPALTFYPDDVNPLYYEFGPGLDPSSPYWLTTAYKRANHGNGDHPRNLPGVLQLVDGVLDVAIVPLYDDLVVPAGMVDLGVEWVKRRSQRPDRVVVTLPAGGGYFGELPNAVPIEYRFDSQLVEQQAALNVALYLLPEQVEDGWSVDTITLYDLPDTMGPTWLGSYFAADGLRTPLVIDQLVSAQNPNGGGYYAGTVVNATLQLARGKWSMTLSMRSDLPRPNVFTATYTVPEPYLSPRNLRASSLGTRPISSLARTLSTYDLRIVRRPD